MFKNLGETFGPTYKEKLWMYNLRTEVGKKRMKKQKELFERFHPIKRGKALDIGCGMGIISAPQRFISKFIKNVWGFKWNLSSGELNPKMSRLFGR